MIVKRVANVRRSPLIEVLNPQIHTKYSREVNNKCIDCAIAQAVSPWRELGLCFLLCLVRIEAHPAEQQVL